MWLSLWNKYSLMAQPVDVNDLSFIYFTREFYNSVYCDIWGSGAVMDWIFSFGEPLERRLA